MLFDLSSGALALFLIVVAVGTAAIGIAAGRRMADPKRDTLREATSALQSTLLGFMGLLLAFGLSMAVGRYENRRSAVVDEANTIGTTYLRAETLTEPMRSRSLHLLVRYTDARIALSDVVPDSDGYDRALADSERLADRLWANAGQALKADPNGSATRLYVESLNEMIDMDTTRRATLGNRIPGAVMWLQIVGAAIALGVLGLHLELHGRAVATVFVAATVVVLILFVTFDLDRPRRGFITVPDTALTSLRTSMDQPPVAVGPSR